MYRIFNNIFYAGIIDWAGKQYQGNHKPIITLEEFDRVQILLGKKGKPRPQKYKFAFTGLIRCAECGCLYTAEIKKKFIKSTGVIKKYTYYHCTRKTIRVNCSQKKVIREEELENQILDELKSITILPDFRDWALGVLNQSNDKEIEDRSKIHESLSIDLLKTQKEIDELTKMRYRELIDDEAFTKEKNLLQSKIIQLKEKLRETEARAERWLELTENTFNFATYAYKNFLLGDLQAKKSIVMALGSNFLMKDGKLTISANNWFLPIKNSYSVLEKEYLRLEPKILPLNKAKTEALASVRAEWLRGWDSNPRPIG
ncbi:recombinase zinc beta ribbon domain-containing protein [Candidatus Falkowbacteria bacterium]|nr:recombinase zinc beta ribbon domain-containing protein [Candidatus Falkowbacteria bacterium]